MDNGNNDEIQAESSPAIPGQEPDNQEQQQQPEKSAENKDESAENKEPESPESEEDKAKKAKHDKVQKRINDLTREKYEERKEKEELRQKLQQMEERLNQLDVMPPEPQYENYDTDAEFKQAYRDWVLKSENVQSRQSTTEKTEQEKQQDSLNKQKEVAKNFSDKANKEADQYVDFWDTVNGDAFSAVVNSMDPQLISLIQSSDQSTALTYHLASNLDITDDLARMSPIQAAKTLATIEIGLSKPESNNVTNAPAPPKPITGNNKVDLPLSEVSDIDEWMAKRNAQLRG